MPRLRSEFRVPVKINLSRIGKARAEFSKLNLRFSRTSTGMNILKEAKKIEPFMNAKHFREQPAQPFKKRYLGLMMDYYNRLLFYAKEQKASQKVIAELTLHTHWLEKEYEKFVNVK